MTRFGSLNTPTPSQWLRVVSPVTWAAYKLSSAGTFTAETLRGPLIVWTTKPGEEEGSRLPVAHASALEDQTAKVNTRAAFERLFWAVGGKLRHSIRWKTRTRRMNQNVRPVLYFLTKYIVPVSSVAKTAKSVFENLGRELKEIRRNLINSLSVKCPSGLIKPLDFGILKNAMSDLELGEYPAVDIAAFARVLKKHIIRYIDSFLEEGITINDKTYHVSLEQLKGWAIEHKDLLIVIFRETLRRKHLAFTTLLKYLEAAAYRAHLARRVKPVQRRTRAPRPLYARPRPPSCPLAPPLA